MLRPMPAPPDAAPLHVVLNAGSGRDDAGDAREAIEGVLGGAGREYRLSLVHDARALPLIARQAAHAAHDAGGIVVAAGGDGTINAVARAVLDLRGVLGVVPLGTFNFFGRAHGIPVDPAQAARLLLHGRPQPVQVGLVNDRPFLVNASLGLYPQLLEDREAYKRRYGRTRLVALWAALNTLVQAHRPLRLQLQWHGQARALRTPTLFVGNNALQLARLGLDDAAALNEGALVALALRPVGTLTMLWLMLRGAFGQLGDSRDVVSFAFEQLSVRPAAPLGHRLVKVATDGEISWLRAPLAFRVAPEPLMLVKPVPEGEPA
jgi:diacylglycerol kinase family enzyme